MRLARTTALPGLIGVHEQHSVTYDQVGATAGPLPDGFHHVHRRTELGRGRERFDRAAAALMSWQMHERSGLHVAARGPVELGRTVVMGVGLGVCLVVPCRVVAVIDEPGRRGFAYGTLPGHPERGEERFLIEQDGDDVRFVVTAFTQPGSRLTRLAGPIATAAQTFTTVRYERALRALG